MEWSGGFETSYGSIYFNSHDTATVLHAGSYLIDAHCCFAFSTASGNSASLRIFKNGVEVGGNGIVYPQFSGYSTQIQASATLVLAAMDQIQVRFFRENGNATANIHAGRGRFRVVRLK